VLWPVLWKWGRRHDRGSPGRRARAALV